ncbi:uncharacterized protein [Hetaerina americana]|uniref:uncharacterized protein isoform X2 n=1 Tax=Hetaerina americana TaxID=62018 RepID=UPI003A7F4B36
MMSVPVVKQAIPSSGGGTTGPVGGGPGAGPPPTQSPGKMVTTGPQSGANILPKSTNPGNPMVGVMGGHSVGQAGGIGQNLQNSSLMKVPPTASSMPILMVANHTASAPSMVHQSLSGVSGTMAPLSLVQEHRAPSTGVPQPTPPAAHNHPTPPMPTQRGSAPPAHSTAPPSTHPPQSGPSANPLSGIDKPKELIVGAKPTSNGVQVQKAGEASGTAPQQARKVSDGPVSLVVNHSVPEAQGNVPSTTITPQPSQQAHSAPGPASGVQISAAKSDSAVVNHAASQPAKSGTAAPAAVANKVSPAPSPVKDKAPSTPTKSVSAPAAPKTTPPATTETNEAPNKSATPAPSSAPQSTTSQATTVKAPAATAGSTPAKPAAPATPAAVVAAAPAPTTAPSATAASSTQGTGTSEASNTTTASPAKPAPTPTPSSAAEEPKVNNTVSSPAKTATENQNAEAKVAVPAETESVTPAAPADKEGKVNTPPSATPSRGSKRKRTEIKPSPTLGSSQAAAIAAASRTPSSKSKALSDLGSAKKDGIGEEDEDEERKPKRVRIRTQPYQSPLPELAYIPKFTRIPTPKAQEDKLILFYKNEFLALRNAEGGFYVCQTMQNIYKHSARIRIRWLSQDTAAPKTEDEKDNPPTYDGEVYSPDFYDSTDFDCILTNLNLDRLERGKYRLPNVELERTQSILKRALDAEKGWSQVAPLTEEHPDGLDLSLYRDESQLKKRRSPRRKSGSGKAKKSAEGGAKSEDGEDKDSSSSSSSSSEDEATEASESPAKKPKREKRAPQTPKEPSTPATPRARGGREAGKRKGGAESEGKAKAMPSAAVAPKKRNNSSTTPARKRRSEAPTVAAPATPATPPARATPARATRSPKSAPAPSRKERSRVKEARKKPGKKA